MPEGIKTSEQRLAVHPIASHHLLHSAHLVNLLQTSIHHARYSGPYLWRQVD